MSPADVPYTSTWDAHAPAGWDDFVEGCEPSHFEQTSWWGNVESGDGWSSKYLVVRGRSKIVAGAMVLTRRQHRLGKVGYAVRGPLTCREEADSEQVRTFLANALKTLARKEGLALLVVVPPYNGSALASTLLGAGFLEHPSSLPPSGLSPGTITVDLRRDLSQIEQGYRRTLRQEVNRAGQQGVVVNLGTADDLGLFWKLHLDLCQRRGATTNVPRFGYVTRVWQEFHRQGRAWLFNARLNDEIICSLMCLGVGQWFYAWRIGWAPDSRKVYPTQAAFARAIQTAREAGFQFFDFMQIHLADVAKFEHGGKPDSPTAGMTFFKLGFGGVARTLPPTLDWFPNPALRLVLRAGALRLLSSGAVTTLVRRVSAVR